MTFEELLARTEHPNAALDEERRKEREEDRQLWRDTQRQIDKTNAAIERFAEERKAGERELRALMAAETKRATAAEEELRARIAALVSAMGEFLSRIPTR